MSYQRGQELSRELRFLKNSFRDHYRKDPVVSPYRFTRREWGFFPFGGKMMFRHISFMRKEELDAFFRDSIPMHAYYSVAYYGDPGMQPMGEKVKTWMGADLIFDLDADHLPNAETMTYTEQLAQVKEEVKSLLFDFILGDLGFDEEHTHLHFSGGRGYHIHVRDPEVLPLDSRDRRQIVDYITGRNLDFNVLFPWKVTDVNTRFGTSKREKDFRSRSYGGWVKKIYDGKDSLIRDLSELEDKKAMKKRLLEISIEKKLDIKEKKCESMIEDLFFKGKGSSADRMIKEDKFSVTASKVMDIDFLKLAASYSSINLKGETDEPVTTDIRRLIRCPGSLHGKTGFKVMEIDKHEIDSFDPLEDTVVLPSDLVKVNVPEPFNMIMKGKEWNLEPGENEIPRYLAYFMVARRLALIS